MMKKNQNAANEERQMISRRKGFQDLGLFFLGTSLIAVGCGETPSANNYDYRYGGQPNSQNGASQGSNNKSSSTKQSSGDKVATGSNTEDKNQSQKGHDDDIIDDDDNNPVVKNPPEDEPIDQDTSFSVVSASPTESFFSRGAPKLTKEQILSGEPIVAVCEGGKHELTITSEHLAALARGETVKVESEKTPHPGNPTNHSHFIVYTPVKA